MAEDLTGRFLDARQNIDGTVRAVQAIPPDVYLQFPETPGATAPPTAPPATAPTEPGVPAGAETPPPAPPASPQTSQEQASGAVQNVLQGTGATTAIPRLPPDLGLGRTSLQALAAYLPEGAATPLLKQAATGLDLLMNLTLIPAVGFGVENARKVEAVLGSVGLDGKGVADATQMLSELGYALVQNPAGAITAESVGNAVNAAKVVAKAGSTLGRLLREAPEALLGTVTERGPMVVDTGTLSSLLHGEQATPETASNLAQTVTAMSDQTGIAAGDVAAALEAGGRIAQRGDLRALTADLGPLLNFAGAPALAGLDQQGQVSMGTALLAGRLLLGALVGGYTGSTAKEQIRNGLVGLGIAASPELVRLLTKGVSRELRALNAVKPVTVPEKVIEISKVAPVPPGTASAGGDTILHFDFERMAGDPQALWAAIDDLVTRRGQTTDAANFGALTTERIEKIADVVGLHPSEITPLQGKILNVQQLDAAADVGIAALTELLDRNAQLQAAYDLNVPAERAQELIGARDAQLVWTGKILTRLYEVAGELGSSLHKWQTLLPALREPMGQTRDLAELVERGLVGSEMVTATLTNMTSQAQKMAPLMVRLWRQGWSIAAGLFQNSLLSGFEATNLLGNMIMTTDYIATNVYAMASSTLKGTPAGERVYWGQLPTMLQGAAVGFTRGLKSALAMVEGNTPLSTIRAGMQALASGEPIMASMAREAAQSTPSSFGTSKVTFMKQRAIGSAEQGIGGMVGLALDTIGQLAYLPTTGVNAVDEVFKFTNREMVLYGEAMRAGLDKGLRDKGALRLFTQDFLHKPPIAVEKIAEDTANLLTLTNPLPDYLSNVRTAMDHPAYRFIAPFWNAPMNLARYNFAHWPGLGRLVSYNQEALAKGGPSAELAKARMALGSVLLGTTAALVWNGDQGIEIPGSGVRVRFRGRGFSDPALNQLERQEHIPYSIGIQTSPDAKWQEWGMARLDYPVLTMGLVADAMAIATRLQDDDLFAEVVTAIGVSTWNNLVDRSTLQGFSDLFSTFTADHPETYVARASRFVRHTAGSVIPMGLAQIEKHMDPQVKEVYTLMDQIMSRTPVVSGALEGKRDVLGDPMMRPLGYPPAVSLFSPVPSREQPGDPVRLEMLKNEVSVMPPPPYLFGSNPDRVGPPDPREAIQLTTGPGSQYERLLDLMTKAKIPASVLAHESDLPVTGGKLNLKQALAAIMKLPEYRRVLSEGQGGGQAKVFKTVINAYRSMAQGVLLSEDQTLMWAYAAKSQDRANALVQPAYQQKRYQPDTGSTVEHLTR